jgi:hypothetical protein
VFGPEADTVLGGNGLTVTAWAADVMLHPLALTVTEYKPLALAVMLWVVAPLFHK